MDHLETNQVFSENLMDARRWLQEERVSLGGKWRFYSQRADLPLPEGWEKPDFQDKKWRRIPVPGSWEESGICDSWFRGDNPPAPFLGPNGPELDQSLNLVGLYRRSFILSKDHGSRQIILRFNHIRSLARLWVNGVYIGMSTDCRTASEFDITSAVHPDKNLICVQILRFTGYSLLEQREQWLPTGILGDVELYSLPSRRITDIQTVLRRNQEGTPLLEMKILAENADGFTARIALMDDKGVVGYAESSIIDGTASALISCPNVTYWTADTPVLYRVAVILWDGIAMYHTRQTTIGFREVVMENGIFRVNGIQEKLYALTYRPFDPATGTIPDVKSLESELRVIREHHFNAIFVSGNISEDLFDLCDKIGLYMLYDCSLISEPEHRDYLGFQNARLGMRLSSHPCLIAWNVEWENIGILKLDRFFRLNAAGSDEITQLLGTEDPEGPDQLPRRRKAQSPSTLAADPDQPLLIVSNQISDYPTYVNLIRSSHRLCGGIFGTYQDNSFLGATAAGGAEGYLSAEGVLRPGIRAVKSILQPIQCSFENEMLTIENHSTHLRTDAFVGKYVLTLDGTELLSRPLDVSVAPGESIRVPLEIRYDIFKPGRYHLSVSFEDRTNGHIISSSQWSVGNLKHIYDENPGGTIREDSGSILMRTQDAAYVISRATGNIEQIRMDDVDLLKNPLFPIYSLPVVSASRLRIPDAWEKLTARRKKPKPSVLEVDHMTRTVTASFHLGSGLMQTYRLFSDGSLLLELRLRTGRTAPDRLGMCCQLPMEFNKFRWFGLGPDDCGTGGQFFAIHEQPARQNAGYKESVYNLTLTNEAGCGIHVRCEDGMRASAALDTDGVRLTLEHLYAEPLKPHTTYSFSITLRAVK